MSEEIAFSFGQRIGTKGFYKVTAGRPRDLRHRRRLHPVRERAGGVPADNPIPGPTSSSTPTRDVPSREYRALRSRATTGSAEPAHRRQLHLSSQERRQLRRRSHRPAGHDSPIGDYPELFPTGRQVSFGPLPPSRSTSSACFRPTPGFRPRRTPALRRALELRLGNALLAGRARCTCCTPQQRALDPGYAGPPTTQGVSSTSADPSSSAERSPPTSLSTTPCRSSRTSRCGQGRGAQRVRRRHPDRAQHQVEGDRAGPQDAVGLPLTSPAARVSARASRKTTTWCRASTGSRWASGSERDQFRSEPDDQPAPRRRAQALTSPGTPTKSFLAGWLRSPRFFFGSRGQVGIVSPPRRSPHFTSGT